MKSAVAQSSSIISAAYQGIEVHFTGDAWFNATEVAEKFGKRPTDWLRLDETKVYIEAMAGALGAEAKVSQNHFGLVVARRGGKSPGTWLHPKLAVRFSQWLDVRFAVWCDATIDSLLRAPLDHDRSRLKAATTFKLLTDMVKLKREEEGKAVAAHHFSNEARLVNFALTGKFDSVDRDQLSSEEMGLLVRLEEMDIMLLGSGKTYEERKARLVSETEAWRAKRSIPVVH